MNSQKYLESYGWTPGQPLQKGGIKKPILVSHKFDLKGVGHGAKESVSWWETLFDGHLKSLDVNGKDGFGADDAKREALERAEKKKQSPLYQMFVKGEVLRGTAELAEAGVATTPAAAERQSEAEQPEQLMFFFSSDDESDNESRRRRKRAKKDKKVKNKKDKKYKKDKKLKDKKDKDKKDKKERKDKKKEKKIKNDKKVTENGRKRVRTS